MNSDAKREILLSLRRKELTSLQEDFIFFLEESGFPLSSEEATLRIQSIEDWTEMVMSLQELKSLMNYVQSNIDYVYDVLTGE